MKAVFVLALLLSCGLAFAQDPKPTPPARSHSVTGTIRTHEGFDSKLLGNKRDILVYLPPGYEKEPNRRYPVLYMHDGQNIFDGFTSYIPNEEWKADEAAQALIESNLIEPIIIVGIPNMGAERANEYLPTHWTSDPKRFPAMGGKADLYGRMITDELMPFIDKTYRTKTGPKNTALCGSSFGGVVSLHVGMTRPEAFGKLGVFSPSLWWNDRLLIENVKKLPKKLSEKIWVDIGTNEGEESLPDTLALKDALIAKGWTLGKDLAVYVDGYARHSERAWANRFPAFLLFIYGRK